MLNLISLILITILSTYISWVSACSGVTNKKTLTTTFTIYPIVFATGNLYLAILVSGNSTLVGTFPLLFGLFIGWLVLIDFVLTKRTYSDNISWSPARKLAWVNLLVIVSIPFRLYLK